MEEIHEGEEEAGEEEVGDASAALPTQMKLLSTWEVRRVPHNCVTRSVQSLTTLQALCLSLATCVYTLQAVYSDSDETGGEGVSGAWPVLSAGGRGHEDWLLLHITENSITSL